MNHSSPLRTDLMPHVHHIIVHTDQPDKMPQFAHQHNSLHKITLILSGGALSTVDGQRYHVTAGDIIICHAGKRNTLIPQPSLCYFTIFFDHAPDDFGTEAFLPGHFYHCGNEMPNLKALADLLCTCTNEYASITQSHLLSALLLICANGISAEPTRLIDKSSSAYAMSKFIDQHYEEDIFLSNIADAAGITSSHAIHVFKPIFEMSPVQHLNSRRIGQAQAYLLLTDLSASQIASRVGIGNINYFYTVFKKLVGMSPSSYRTYFQDKMRHFSSSY